MSPAFLSHDPQPLMEIIKKLEIRVRTLEKILELSEGGLHLRSGSSSIKVNARSIVISAHDIQILGTGKVSVKASGDLQLKGSKIIEN